MNVLIFILLLPLAIGAQEARALDRNVGPTTRSDQHAAAVEQPIAETAESLTASSLHALPPLRPLMLAEMSQPSNHIPTTASCLSCHTVPNTTPGPKNRGVMNHATIVNDCTKCHAPHVMGISFFGVAPRPQGAGHIPTTADCVVCHKSTSQFRLDTAMNHAGIKSECASCHAAGRKFSGIAIKTPGSEHVAIDKPCEACHKADDFTHFGGEPPNRE